MELSSSGRDEGARAHNSVNPELRAVGGKPGSPQARGQGKVKHGECHTGPTQRLRPAGAGHSVKLLRTGRAGPGSPPARFPRTDSWALGVQPPGRTSEGTKVSEQPSEGIPETALENGKLAIIFGIFKFKGIIIILLVGCITHLLSILPVKT